MNEYITISSAVNVLSAYGGYSLEDAERIVTRNCAAADVVEVIQCKDCIHWRARSSWAGDCAKIGQMTPELGYCFCGYPKEDGEKWI